MHTQILARKEICTMGPKMARRGVIAVSAPSRRRQRKDKTMAQQNFLFIRRSGPGQAAQGPKPSPAQMEEMYAKFNAWKDKFSDSIVDMGAPLGGGRVVTSQGHSDGPFIEAKEVIGGYMVLSADSLEAAEAMVREMPGVVAPGASVEIREIKTP